MSWKVPANYQPRPNLDVYLSTLPKSRVGTAESKMVLLVSQERKVADLQLTPDVARDAVDQRIVPLKHYGDVLGCALARPEPPARMRPIEISDTFKRLVEIDIEDAWDPGGDSFEEDRELIAAIAVGAFEAADADDRFDNPELPAGYTYLGQFIDHDITRDARPLDDNLGPARNLRRPTLDLDCVYGDGPPRDDGNNDKLAVGCGFDGAPDLPRERDDSESFFFTGMVDQNQARIGDDRNDENLLVSQIHLAFLRFHNARVDEGMDFAAAKASTIRHYQAVVLQDFLPRVCGAALVAGLRDGSIDRRFAFPKDGQVFMPMEFSMAAYRFGHALVRPSYELNDRMTDIAGAIPIFNAFGARHLALASLRGGRRLPANWSLQFDRFFDFDGQPPAQRARLIDRSLARPLMDLPLADECVASRRSLAFRNLFRGWRNDLPSGQFLARKAGLMPIDPGLEAPLWLYVLEEARQQTGGRHLGALGGHIVAETFLGILQADPESILNCAGTLRRAPYGFPDFVRDAGMPVDAIDIEILLGKRDTTAGQRILERRPFHHA